MPGKTLIIGYGNTLRGDDGVGRLAAEQVAALGWPGCEVLSVHQLTPELALAIAEVDRVIFLDARAVAEDCMKGDLVEVRPLDLLGSSNATFTLGHRGDPAALLGLAKVLYGKTVAGWWVLIGAVAFDYGETLSPLAERAQGLAVETVQSLLEQAGVLEGEG